MMLSVPPTSPNVVERPCDPPPCGPHSTCRPVGNAPVCACQSGYLGIPPECRPACVSSSECAPTQACLNSKCQDPCTGTCGKDAECKVVNHNPICVCPAGWTGDPLTGCRIIPSKKCSFATNSLSMNNWSNYLKLCNNRSSYSKSWFWTSNFTTHSAESMHAQPLRTKFAVPSCVRPSSMWLHAQYDRLGTQLPTGMLNHFWLPIAKHLR